MIQARELLIYAWTNTYIQFAQEPAPSEKACLTDARDTVVANTWTATRHAWTNTHAHTHIYIYLSMFAQEPAHNEKACLTDAHDTNTWILPCHGWTRLEYVHICTHWSVENLWPGTFVCVAWSGRTEALPEYRIYLPRVRPLDHQQ